MSAFEEDLFEDLAYDEAEGAAELEEVDELEALDELEGEEAFYDDEADEWEGAEEMFGEEDEFSDFELEAADEYDDYEGFDEFGDAYEEDEAEDMMDGIMAFALDAEDTDEFFKKLFRGIKKVARRVGRVVRKAAPVVGRIARVAAPILSSIPTPWTQVAGRAASLLGRLRAEGATEEEALDAFAELAVKDPRALPIVAGLTARTVLKSKGARMSYGARKRAVKDAKTAAKTLVRKRGRAAIRALPKIAKSVKRTAAAKATPAAARTKIVKRAAAKVARSPALTRKLARPSPKAKRIVKTAVVKARSYTIPGPARITISSI